MIPGRRGKADDRGHRHRQRTLLKRAASRKTLDFCRKSSRKQAMGVGATCKASK